MSFFSQLHYLDRDPFMSLNDLWNVRHEQLCVDVAPELFHLNRLLPEIDDVDGLLQDFNDADDDSLQRLPIFGRCLPAFERQLQHIVIEGRGLLR